MLDGANEIMVLGCRSCTAICLAGGEKESKAVCEALSLHSELKDKGWKVDTLTVERACEKEFLEPLTEFKGTVVSMACGVGAQVLQELCPKARVVPGVNTSNLGRRKAWACSWRDAPAAATASFTSRPGYVL